MKTFITCKHWHLFLLMVIPLCWLSPEPWQSGAHCFGLLVYAAWIRTIGVTGASTLRKNGVPSRDPGLFKVNCLLMPLLYLILIVAYDPVTESDWIEYLLAPVAIYFLFAAFQTVTYSVKALTALEIKRQPVFRDWIVNFLWVLILPVGIWILQPKVNRLVANR